MTNGRIVESMRPQKEETYRTKLTVGGNLLDYHGGTSTPTIDLTITNIYSDIENFYLNNILHDC